MPLFEFICQDCGRSFEKILPRYDSPAECNHCNSKKVEKQLSVFAVAGGSGAESSSESFSEGPGCGRCGAAQPGMCNLD